MEVEGKLQLWTATAYPIWQEVDVQAPDAMQQATVRVSACVEILLEQLQSQGFPAETLPSGQLLKPRIQASGSRDYEHPQAMRACTKWQMAPI